MNDRFNAIEGQTVRLFLFNYVSNVLTDIENNPTKKPEVIIKAKGTNTVLATLTSVRQEIGVYYADWSVPSSNPESQKFKGDFPGSGFYQDVWTIDSTVSPKITHSQDFFVFPEGYDTLVATVVEPLRFDFILNTPRFEFGAKDFISLTLKEKNSRIVDTEDIFPEGEIQLLHGNDVIFNYDKLIHKSTSSEYKYFLDTTPLKSDIYKIQARFTIPASTENKKAFVISDKTLVNGFNPSSGSSLLELSVDGAKQNVLFPSTADKARITTNLVEPLSFFNSANDLFIVNIDGTERERRIIKSSSRTVTGLVDELNGVFPTSDFSGTKFPVSITPGFPIITATETYNNTLASTLDGLDLSFEIDGIIHTVVFQNVSTAIVPQEEAVNQINNSVGATVAGFYDTPDNVLFLTDSSASSIKIIGGEAAKVLGFKVGQEDKSKYGLKLDGADPDIAAIDSGKIKLSAEQSITILTPSEGSIANEDLGFNPSGESASSIDATPSSITGAVISPISVVNPTVASVTTNSSVETLLTNVTSIDSDTITITSDIAPINVVLTDDFVPGAITSGFFTQSYTFSSSNNKLKIRYSQDNGSNFTDIDTTFTTGTLNVEQIVNEINNSITTSTLNNEIVADIYQGRLRIRMRKIDSDIGGTTVQKLRIIKDTSTSTSFDTLGFEGITDSPELVFRNDQVVLVGDDLEASDYIVKPTAAGVVNKINSAATSGEFIATLLEDGRIKISSPTVGSPSSISVVTSVSYLDFVTTFNVGTDGQNYNIVITLDALGTPITQTASFEDGIRDTNYFVQQINNQIVGVLAENVSGALKISDQITGAGRQLELTDTHTTVGTNLSGLGFTPVSGKVIANNGSNSIPAEIIATNTPATLFVSNSNGILKMKLSETDPFVSINLSGITTGTGVASAIASAFPTTLNVNFDTVNSILTIETLSIGSNNSFIRIGSINEGSSANLALNISSDGSTSIGTDGIPYTIEQIIDRINAAFGGNIVASNSANFIKLESIQTGAGASLEIGSKTTNDILTDWGLPVGKFFGDSTTRVAQVIVSPKLTFTLGE